MPSPVFSALAAFSEQVHVWYSILPRGFSEQYFRLISDPLKQSVESCLALLVLAIGTAVQNDAFDNDALRTGSGASYFEAALASLPLVINECTVTSVQCLILFSIYFCCLLKPCQAHDYILIASFKVQNLLKA